MATITVTVEVAIDSFHAWEYYFNQINGWWPKDYYTSDKTKRLIIDTFLGGYIYEDHGEGAGLIWGDVIGVDYPHTLQVRGNLTREFGGPAVTFEKYLFESTQNGTQVTFTMDFVGDISEKGMHSIEEAWKEILRHFKTYCTKQE